MLHVNRRDGFTIAVSENKFLAPIAKRSILSSDAMAITIPILEEIAADAGGHDRAAQRYGVARRYQQTRRTVDDEIRNPALTGTDDRNSSLHCFKHDGRARVVPSGRHD